MPRLLFEKTGNAVWISHLDLMRLFQRAFQRAGLPLTHSRGFNPRPSVSIALPLSVGVESVCELLDFDLEGEAVSCEEIRTRLNPALTAGVRVLSVYENGGKIRDLALLECRILLEYDRGIPDGAAGKIAELFARDSLIVEKKGKSGVTRQDIRPMIRRIALRGTDERTLTITALICCQNPTLNPMQLTAAIGHYMPECAPDFAKYRRMEIYDREENIFR